jgi:GxxExxY protein
LLESIYEAALCQNSYLEGCVYTGKDLCKLYIKEVAIREPLFIDVVVEDKVLVEVKATEKNHPFMKHRFLHI